MNSPKVSVCIPSYNCARFLPGAIESVLNQSFADFELIIADDCSADESREVIGRYAARDRRIAPVLSERNRGMVPNWNFCLELSRGEYIHFLFCDDLLASSDAIGRMVEVLDNDRSVSLAGSARHFIDEAGSVLKTESRFPSGIIAEGTVIINRCIREARNLIGEPSVVMFRREQGRRGFDPRYRQLVDLEMWLHLLEQGRFSFLGEPLASFRVHAGQQTRQNVRDLAHIDDMFLLLDDYLGKGCIRGGSMDRWFMYYNQCYRIWKLYRQGLLDRATARRKIAGRRTLWSFQAFLPLYKVYSPCFKARNSLAARLAGVA